MKHRPGNAITIRFALPSAELSPFITTYYYTEVATGQADGSIEDYLHPEWANLRFLEKGMSRSVVGAGEMVTTPSFSVTGPTSVSTRFALSDGRSWGIGLMPLGWAKFVDAPAGDFADTAVDGMAQPAFAALAPLALMLAKSQEGFAHELALIEEHMASLLDRDAGDAGDEEVITAINAALVSGEIATVSELAEHAGLTVRTLERLSRRAFGFTPKLLLRRQRFLRSLAQFMLDPSLKWLNMIDSQYHDQAHFVRDFRRFMGMSPSEYGKLDHPFLRAAAQARAAIAGEAVQGLHEPTPPVGDDS